MRHVAAYMLAVLGGNASPSKDDVTKILASVGVDADNESLDRFMTQMEGKDFEEVLAAGQKKLAKFGGGAPAAGGAGGAAAGGAAAAAPEEEEEEEEEAEEVDLGGGMDMFGGGGDDY